MKIALVSPYDLSFPGGVTEHVTALAGGLARRGHQVHLVAACSNQPQVETMAAVTLQCAGRAIADISVGGATARVGVSPLSFCRVRQFLQRQPLDIIHLQEPLTPGLNWWMLLLARHLSSAALIGTFHAYHDQLNWLQRLGRPFLRRLFAKLNGLITVSEAAQTFAASLFPGNYRLIPNGIDVERFAPPAAKPLTATPAKTILFVGRPDRRKGFDDLFAAFVWLKARYPHLRLQVVGPFSAAAQAHYRALAQQQGVTNPLFAGYINPQQLPRFYHQADIFCAPSVGNESFGMVLLEAMAAGLPIVASDIVGYNSLLTAGQQGLLTPPRQPAALAGALQYLLDNPQRCHTMGQCGRATARRYSWDIIIDQTLEVYHTAQSGLVTAVTPSKKDVLEQHCAPRRNYVKRSRTQI